MRSPIAGFIEQLKIKNASPRTIQAYQMHLGLLARYCERQGQYDVKEITLEDLREYHKNLLDLPGKRQGSKLSPNTLHLKLRILKVFFAFWKSRALCLSIRPNGWIYPF